jgi:hypothetical protein
MKDLQLAIAIARVYEGDTGPVLKGLLENDVLAVAAKEGNRWLASWAFWMLKRKDMAVRALIVGFPIQSRRQNNMSSESDYVWLDSCLYASEYPGVSRSESEAIPHRRPSLDCVVLPTTPKESADPSRSIQGHAPDRMGLCDT